MKLNKDTNWKILFTTRRYLVESVAMIVVSVCIVLLAIIPQVQAFLELRSKQAEEQEEVEKLEAKIANLESVKISQEFSKAELINQALPAKKPLSELLVSLQSSADRSNASIVDFEVSPGDLATQSAESKSKKTSNDYEYLEMNVTLEGKFTDVQNFLTQVEQFAPFTVISNVSLDTQSDPSDTQVEDTNVKAELTLRTYYYTKSVQTAVETILPDLTPQNIEVLNEVETFIAITVPEQDKIEGGGNEELFGEVDTLF